MVFEFPEDKFLLDGHGDIVSLTDIKSIHYALNLKGYERVDLSYGNKGYLLAEEVETTFEKVENSSRVVNSTEGKFSNEYLFWYHKDLDMFLNVSQKDSDMMDEADVPSQEYYKVIMIYYNSNKADKVTEYLNTNIVKTLSSSNKIDIIIQSQRGYEFKSHTIKAPSININTMYNDDFEPVYDHIVDKLNNGGKGVVLFYGDPGTGKTSMIKHLTTVVKHKFVFVPISMIAHVASPQFIGDLINNKGGVLVLEDCENFIQDRKSSQDSIVSPLLQITDGILSDILDIKIICTFNTDLTRVDEALRREGRLIAEYKFEELSQEKATALAGKTVEGKKTLANIFNDLTFKENKKEEKQIGFGR